MSFDLIAYARKHRYRIRNLHDGSPVPPTRRTRNRGSPVNRGVADRDDAILCRDAYVHAGGYGGSRIGFCVLCRSKRALAAKLRALIAAGATITQSGDAEAAGHAPVSQIDAILTCLRPYRRREAPVGAGFPGRKAIQPAHPVSTGSTRASV